MARSSTKEKTEREARLVKYMGASHVRIIPKGDKLGGELTEGVPEAVTWDIAEHHLATMPTSWSDTQIDALLDYDDGNEFIDVTGQERVKASLGQQIWRGAKSRISVEEDLPEQDTEIVDASPSGASMEGGQSTTADPATST